MRQRESEKLGVSRARAWETDGQTHTGKDRQGKHDRQIREMAF